MHRASFLKILSGLGILAISPKMGVTASNTTKKSMPSAKPKVIIIGAGLSGLEAASHLLENGCDVEIIEAQNHIGGRTLSEKYGSKRLDIGAQFISAKHTNILRYCQNFKLSLIPTSEKGRFALVTSGNKVYQIGAIPPINKITLGLDRALKEFNKLSKRIDWHDEIKSQNQLATLDQLSVEDWIVESIRNEEVQKLFRSAIAPIYSPSTQTHSLANAVYINHTNGSFKHLSSVKDGAQEFYLDNGTQQIAEGIASEFLDKISLNEKVEKILFDGTEFQITTDKGLKKADYLLCCLSPLHLKNILFSDVIQNSIQQETSHIATKKEVKIHLLFRTKFWSDLKLSGSSLLANGVVVSTIDGTPLNADYAVLTGFISSAAAETWFETTKEERLQIVLKQLETVFSKKIWECQEMVESNWQYGCFHYYQKGFWQQKTDQTQKANQSILFAGTEFASQFNGYMEGAILSGQKAAQDILLKVQNHQD